MTAIASFLQSVRNGAVTLEEHAFKALEEAKRIDNDYAYFNELASEQFVAAAKAADKERKELLRQGKPLGHAFGLPITVKDGICTKGIQSSAGSAILRGYRPPFDATAVARCKAHGALVLGKTSQDEFGFGSFNVNVGVGLRIPKNPLDTERACGGSSGGAAGFTRKTQLPHIALGESTGGSIVAPAAFCGVVGICPTYGRVSRYGLIDYANSLDKIGPMAKTVGDAAMLLGIMSGEDPLDSTSAPRPTEPFQSYATESVKGLRIGVLKEGFGQGVDPKAEKLVRDAIGTLESRGATITEVSLPLTAKYGLAAYYILALSEASTNLAKYCGMRYGAAEPIEGNFNEYFSAVRSKHFGTEAKRRIILGTFARMAGYRDAFYGKAGAVRTLIIDEYKRAFRDIDAIASPTMPIPAPRFEDIAKLTPLQSFQMDILTVGPNLAGLPHMSVPCGDINGLPVGILLTGNHFDERSILRGGGSLE